VGGAKNSEESLKILAESASYDFSAENKQRMLNSSTFCGFLLTKSVFLRLSARKMANNALNTGFLPEFTMRF
jgi:hypothetical protein